MNTVLNQQDLKGYECQSRMMRNCLVRFVGEEDRATYASLPDLKESRPETLVEPLRIKIDPGSKTTGLSLVNDATGEVVWAAELQHRGFAIKDALTNRRQLRRSRRNRKTRYRQPRFDNRKRPEGWLPPSLGSRIDNIETWVKRLRKFANIAAISQELVRFDTQLMQNPEIQGKEYQQGTLADYETCEYLLEKWNRQCAYCEVKDVHLQVEHIHPRAKGGSNRISNLTLSCEKCNIKKGTQDIKEFNIVHLFTRRTVTHMVHSVSDFWTGTKVPCSFLPTSYAVGFQSEEVR